MRLDNITLDILIFLNSMHEKVTVKGLLTYVLKCWSKR